MFTTVCCGYNRLCPFFPHQQRSIHSYICNIFYHCIWNINKVPSIFTHSTCLCKEAWWMPLFGVQGHSRHRGFPPPVCPVWEGHGGKLNGIPRTKHGIQGCHTVTVGVSALPLCVMVHWTQHLSAQLATHADRLGVGGRWDRMRNGGCVWAAGSAASHWLCPSTIPLCVCVCVSVCVCVCVSVWSKALLAQLFAKKKNLPQVGRNRAPKHEAALEGKLPFEALCRLWVWKRERVKLWKIGYHQSFQ